MSQVGSSEWFLVRGERIVHALDFQGRMIVFTEQHIYQLTLDGRLQRINFVVVDDIAVDVLVNTPDGQQIVALSGTAPVSAVGVQG